MCSGGVQVYRLGLLKHSKDSKEVYQEVKMCTKASKLWRTMAECLLLEALLRGGRGAVALGK